MDTTTLSTVTLPEMVDLVRRQFLNVQNMVKPASGVLFISDPIGKGAGASKRFTEIDTETYGRRKRELEKAKKAAVGVGYSVDTIKKRIAREIEISQEMRDENRYAEVGSLITSLTHFCPQRIELDGTHIFTFAAATSMTDMDGETVTLSTGDGLSLINSAHTLKYNSGTYSNRVSGDPLFTGAALRAAEKLATTNIVSHFGERRVMNFNTIVTGDDPDTVAEVKRYLNSMSDPDAAHSGVINPIGSYRHVILPQLATTATGAHDSTKERYWFLVAAGQGLMGWQAFYSEWEAPHFKDLSTDDRGANHDYSADSWVFGTRAAYNHRAVSPRGIIGSLPTSA